MEEVDVVIVGGGPAGLSAALCLGRARRRVVVLDAGSPRHAVSEGVHNFLSREGIAPAALRDEAWAQMAAYPSVRRVEARVSSLRESEGGWLATDGERSWRARAAILATGVIDVLAYPQYPTVGPHEAVAVVLVLPAIEGPLLVLALWRSLALSGRAWICAAVLGAAVVLATLHGGGDMDWKLPLSAQVSRLASTELQDYSVYRLHARNVTREEAERYASTLGLAASPADTTCELGAADWVRSEDVACPPSEGLHWERDDRSANGLGCVVHSTWAVEAL